jgi:hypothetical protein
MRSKTLPLSLTPAQQAAVDALCEHKFRLIGADIFGPTLLYTCRHCDVSVEVDANAGPVPPPVPDDAPCVVLVRGIVSHDEDGGQFLSPADSLDPSVDGILTDSSFRYTLGSFRGRGGRKTDLSPDGWSPSIAALAAYEDDAIREGVVEAREWCAFLRRWSEVLTDKDIEISEDETEAFIERVLALPAPRRLSESKYVAGQLASLLDEWTEVAPDAPLRPYVDAVADVAGSSAWAKPTLSVDWTPSRWLVYDDAVAFQLAAWCGVAESFRLNVEDDVATLVNDIDALVQEIEYIFLDRLGPGMDVEADEIDAVAEWLKDWDYEPCYVRDLGSNGCDICGCDLSEDYGRRGDHIFVLVEKRRPDGSQRDNLKARREEWDHHFQGHYYQYSVEQMILRRPSDIEEDGWEFMDSCSGFLETEPYAKDNYVHTEAREVVARVVKDRADEGAVVFDLGVFDRD